LDAGLIKLLGGIGWRWKQLTPMTSNDTSSSTTEDYRHLNAKNCYQVGKVSGMIKKHIETECADDNFPLILGGDHCISIGTISAIKAARPKTAIVWVRIFSKCKLFIESLHIYIYIYIGGCTWRY
jgi:arginase